MNKLTQIDLRFVVSRIPKDIREVMKYNRLFLGGGFIRETIAGGKVVDVDLFVTSKESALKYADTICKNREGSKHFSSDNAITIISPPRLPIQFITRWLYNDPLKVVESFDFTVCQAAIWVDVDGQWTSACADNFYSDLAARRLVYTYPVREEAAGGSMLRMRKFIQRGYNIQAESMAGVLARCVKGIGVLPETKTAEKIADRLREVDPLVVIDGVEPVNEHDNIENF